jgi:hypothetical protein
MSLEANSSIDPLFAALAIIFDTFTISDGLPMGSKGTKFPLVSRPAMAESSPIPSRPSSAAAAWTPYPSARRRLEPCGKMAQISSKASRGSGEWK